MNTQVTESGLSQQAYMTTLALVAILALGCGAGLSWWLQQHAPYQAKTATLWPTPTPLTAFALRDQDGNAFTLAQLRGKWSLFFFGYTHCPDVCPSTLAMLNLVAEQVQKTPNIAQHLQFVFVSVDPTRDTAATLKPYLAYFNADFIGVTGTLKDIVLLSLQFSLPIARRVETTQDYQMDHSATMILINPQQQKHAAFTAPHAPDLIAQDLIGVIQ